MTGWRQVAPPLLRRDQRRDRLADRTLRESGQMSFSLVLSTSLMTFLIVP
jgi:hypothetical protein